VFYALSKILDVFLSPLTWALVFCLAGLVRRYERWTRWAPAAAAGLLYLFSTGFVSNALLRNLEASATRTMRDGVVYDAAILLGGAVSHGSTRTWNVPSYNDNVERLLTAFDLLRSGRARTVIISGGRGDPADPIVEARVLGKQLEDWGIEPERIILEEHARNTRENATESKRIAAERHFQSLLMITSARHVPRALESFRRVGLAADTLPVDYRSTDRRSSRSILPRSDDLDISVHALREILGGWIYKAAF
jgi:uncharacterized SAM-binding protein YcdF (DUF218 family)